MNDNIISAFLKTVYDGKGVKDGIKDLKEFNNEKDKINSTIKPLALGKALLDVTSKIIGATKKSSDFVESLNLLDVAFNNNTADIRKFTSAFSETLNLDESTLIRAAGHFKVLSQSMGLANEQGEKFSKLLTQMTLDVSSLYNLDFNEAQSALQYAVEGRGTTLKQKTGVSVLETSVQTTLDTLGVDAYVEDMTDAEKAIARLISMEYQLRYSQGDLARTINCGTILKNIVENFVNLCKKGVYMILNIYANGKAL